MRVPYQGSSQRRGMYHWHPSESVTKADSLSREDSKTGILSFLVSVAEAFLVKA